jgi:serine protease AprX
LLPLIVTYTRPPRASDVETLTQLGAEVTTVMGSVDGCSAIMTLDQALELSNDDYVESIVLDVPMVPMLDVGRKTLGQHNLPTQYTGLTGAGVTVAVLDSGVAAHADVADRVIASVDIVGKLQQARESNQLLDTSSTSFLSSETSLTSTDSERESASLTASGDGPSVLLEDPYGHGTHVAGIIASDGGNSHGRYRGVAPGANIVSVRVLDENGGGTTSGVIAGLDWVTQNKDRYGIRVVNMSLGHPVFEHPGMDPLVQAVERAWEAGLIVVCSAGNWGSYGHFTINSPGNSRRVITVGSFTDWNTSRRHDDMISSFSSRGPALGEQTLKPDVVAPGNRIVSLRSPGSTLDIRYPDWQVKVGKGSPGTLSSPAAAWQRRLCRLSPP